MLAEAASEASVADGAATPPLPPSVAALCESPGGARLRGGLLRPEPRFFCSRAASAAASSRAVSSRWRFSRRRRGA